MNEKITALGLVVGMVVGIANAADLYGGPQNIFNIGFDGPVEQNRSLNAEESTTSKDSGEAMEVKSFAITGLNDIVMEYDESRKELSFKNKTELDPSASTDYSLIDFNGIQKFIFDKISLKGKNIVQIRDFFKSKQPTVLGNIKEVEFKNYQGQEGLEYAMVIRELAGHISVFTTDGKVDKQDLSFIVEIVKPEDKSELTIRLKNTEDTKYLAAYCENQIRSWGYNVRLQND